MDAKKQTLATLPKTEEAAREYLERIRWPAGPACPREGCGSMDVTKLRGKSTRPGVYKCKGCRKPFTVSVGTIFEDSHIPLTKWVMAFHLMCSSKKGISALQLQRNLGLGSYKSAWHMAHRIRHAMRSEPLASLLKGTVEADESWVGGKPKLPTPQDVKRRNRAKWTNKKPVMVLISRESGEARSFPLGRVTAENLEEALTKNVHPSAKLYTDERPLYNEPGKLFEGGHESVNQPTSGQAVTGGSVAVGCNSVGIQRLRRREKGPWT